MRPLKRKISTLVGIWLWQQGGCCKRTMDGTLNFGVVAIVFNPKSVQNNEGNSFKSPPIGAALSWVPQ